MPPHPPKIRGTVQMHVWNGRVRGELRYVLPSLLSAADAGLFGQVRDWMSAWCAPGGARNIVVRSARVVPGRVIVRWMVTMAIAMHPLVSLHSTARENPQSYFTSNVTQANTPSFTLAGFSKQIAYQKSSAAAPSSQQLVSPPFAPVACFFACCLAASSSAYSSWCSPSCQCLFWHTVSQ